MAKNPPKSDGPLMTQEVRCPCHSSLPYAECCRPYHFQQKLPDPAALMRSRYSAYALSLADYIIKTAHPKSPHHQNKQQILAFCASTQFTGLDILSYEPGENKAYVTFRAHLIQDGKDASFTERSLFEKTGGRWLYVKGS